MQEGLTVKVVERERECLICGESKPWSAFYAARKWPDGTMRSPQSYCKVCRTRIGNEWQRKNREWRREYDRRRYARLRQDPEWVGIRREIDREAKRRRFNHRPREAVLSVLPVGELAPAPFAAWLRDAMACYEGGLTEIARLSDVSSRTLSAVLHGERERVSLDVVDRVLVADGSITLNDLYPLD